MSPGGGEFARIDRLVEILGTAARPTPGGLSIGDDAATLEAGEAAVGWTVDTLVEGVHFRFDWLDPEAVGWRALAASLSDLAAIGARPLGALVAVAGPIETLDTRLEGIYEGVARLARRASCAILGGDLSRAPGPLHLTLTALGSVMDGGPLRRDGARPGDEVWLTGTLGAPAAVVALLDRGIAGARDHPAYPRFATPDPRSAEIAWLLERVPIHAAIDLSDGLSGDAAHVARRSGVEIAIESARVPVHPGAAAATADGDDLRRWALHGGEEFELLFTAPAGAVAPHVAAFEAGFGVRLSRIGAVREGAGVVERNADGERPLPAHSWDHFG